MRKNAIIKGSESFLIFKHPSMGIANLTADDFLEMEQEKRGEIQQLNKELVALDETLDKITI